MSNRASRFFALALVASTGLLSCVANVEEPVEGTFCQSLYNGPSQSPTLWCSQSGYLPCTGTDPTPPMINVCWEAFAGTEPERAAIQENIRRSWNRFARVNLVGWNYPCSAGQAGLHVGWNPGVCYGNNDGSGKTELNQVSHGLRFPDCNGSCNTVASTACPSNPKDCCMFKVAQHELGHGLGFWHEEDIPNQPDCNNKAGSPGGQRYGAYNTLSMMSEAPCGDPMGYLPDLLPGDMAAVQRAYGRRIRGSIVSMNARCVASYGSATGQDGFTWDCDEFENDQEWDYTVGTQKLNVLGNTSLCLGVLSGSPLNPVELVNCADTGQGITWNFRNAYIRGFGKCLDLANGNTSGGPVQAWDCGAFGGANQKWLLTTLGELRFGTSSACLTVPSSGSGQLTVTTCTGISRQKFTFGNADQQIRSVAFSSKCVDTQGWWDSDYLTGTGLPYNGAAVQLYDCYPNQFNQKWNFSNGEIYNNLHGRCLERAHTANGSALSVKVCNSSVENQKWDYYPL